MTLKNDRYFFEDWRAFDILVTNCNPANGVKCKSDNEIKEFFDTFVFEINLL